jgi:hypothetical protein
MAKLIDLTSEMYPIEQIVEVKTKDGLLAIPRDLYLVIVAICREQIKKSK